MRFSWVVAGVISVIAVGCREAGVRSAENEGAAAGGGVPVQVAPVKRGSVPYWVKGIAELAPAREVDVTPKTAGSVARITVQMGERVRMGQVVAQLDTREQQLRLEESENSVRAAEAALHEKKRALAEAESQLEQARKLKERELISRVELEQAENRARSAQAQAELAGAVLAQREAARAQARYRLDHATVEAPVSGVIGRRFLEAGGRASVSTPILTIAVLDPLRAVIDIPESAAALVAPGKTIALDTESPKIRLTGRIVRLLANPAGANTVKLEIYVANQGGVLKPSGSARVSLLLGEKKDALLVRDQALLEDGGMTYVYTVESGKATKQMVKTGWAENGSTEILEGLGAHQFVAVAGNRELKNGAKVELLPAH